jgi:hypothetical protein
MQSYTPIQTILQKYMARGFTFHLPQSIMDILNKDPDFVEACDIIKSHKSSMLTLIKKGLGFYNITVINSSYVPNNIHIGINLVSYKLLQNAFKKLQNNVVTYEVSVKLNTILGSLKQNTLDCVISYLKLTHQFKGIYILK